MPYQDRTTGFTNWRKARFVLFAAIVGLTAQQAALSQQAAPPAPAMSTDEADAIILDRQLIMQELDDHAGALGEIAAGLKPAADLALHANAVAKAARDARKSFEPKVPGGAAKPEIWTNWEDYSKRMDAFVLNAEKMAKVSEGGNVVQVTEMLIDALPCKACHDVYRVKK